MSERELFLHGEPQTIDVAAIERELASLWRQAAKDTSAVMRACSWNLVVLTNDAQLARAKALSEVFVELVPSRTLLINEAPDGADALRAFVSANCRLLPGGGKMLCTEDITLEARGASVAALPSLVRALQVPDISTAVLCAGVPPESAMLSELVHFARRVIVDSRGLDVEDFDGLGSGAIDLAWLRIAPWQQAIAESWDEQRFEKNVRVALRVPDADASEGRWLATWLRNALQLEVTVERGEAMVVIGGRVISLPELLHDDRELITAALATGVISPAYKLARDAFRTAGSRGASCSWADFTTRFVDAANTAIAARGVFTCALTGGSAVKMYAQLARLKLDWSRIEFFLGDERLVPLESPDSNYRAVREALPAARIHPVRTELSAEAAATDYARLLPDQLDLVHLGMGPDGHVASLFPGHALLHERHAKIAPITDSPKPPSQRVTFTLPTITNAREVWFLVTGEAKKPVANVARTDSTSQLPAALVHRGARRATWFLDL
ncbi:MAG: 6-phosphogluconolactonase [Archangium gephyra]|uniref:6-phosphogluconolactonase n=1 Tax=Archangium gephyra TaxID=48 RepID=A0A2W5SW81_9BACT|nr:MAG: 6-phosphogluconolactonase [Archangium gephyra]